ncbi:hypothetical protein IAT38_006647 [Cryptococcus sp. DSM 104549]
MDTLLIDLSDDLPSDTCTPLTARRSHLPSLATSTTHSSQITTLSPIKAHHSLILHHLSLLAPTKYILLSSTRYRSRVPSLWRCVRTNSRFWDLVFASEVARAAAAAGTSEGVMRELRHGRLWKAVKGVEEMVFEKVVGMTPSGLARARGTGIGAVNINTTRNTSQSTSTKTNININTSSPPGLMNPLAAELISRIRRVKLSWAVICAQELRVGEPAEMLMRGVILASDPLPPPPATAVTGGGGGGGGSTSKSGRSKGWRRLEDVQFCLDGAGAYPSRQIDFILLHSRPRTATFLLSRQLQTGPQAVLFDRKPLPFTWPGGRLLRVVFLSSAAPGVEAHPDLRELYDEDMPVSPVWAVLAHVKAMYERHGEAGMMGYRFEATRVEYHAVGAQRVRERVLRELRGRYEAGELWEVLGVMEEWCVFVELEKGVVVGD